MRNRLTAIVLALLAFSMIAASAASLGGITTSSLGAETDVVAGCDSDGITVDFSVAFSGGEYHTSSVDLSGIAATCNGQQMSVTLLDGTGTAIGSAGPVSVAGTSQSVTISAPADDVAGIAVVIDG